MNKISLTDRHIIKDILAKSFIDNQSVNYIIKQDERKLDRISALMDYSIEMCLRYGEVFISEDKKACALIFYPERKKSDLASTWLDIKLIWQSTGMGNIFKVLKREKLIKNAQKKYKSTYLWFIGIDLNHRKNGAGSKLLDEIILHSKKLNRAILLETSTLRNLPWYKKYGFEIYDELDFGFKLYFLEKPI